MEEDYETLKLDDIIAKNDLWIASMDKNISAVQRGSRRNLPIKQNALTRSTISQHSGGMNQNRRRGKQGSLLPLNNAPRWSNK